MFVSGLASARPATGGIDARVPTLRKTRSPVSTVVPPALLVKQTYLIFGEVSYQYLPMGGGYVMSTAGINLSDVSYTRPRQNTCLTYKGYPVLVANQCPLT